MQRFFIPLRFIQNDMDHFCLAEYSVPFVVGSGYENLSADSWSGAPISGGNVAGVCVDECSFDQNCAHLCSKRVE